MIQYAQLAVPMYIFMDAMHKERWNVYSENGESFDITEYADLHTFDVLLRCIYSYDSNCVEKKRLVL